MQKLKELYQKRREVIDYLFWGVVVTVLNILLLPLFMAMGMSPSLANLLDLCLCILFAYATNRRFVFRSQAKGRAALQEFLSFLAGRAVTGIIDQGIIMAAVDHFGPAAAQGLAQGLGMFEAQVWLGLWATGWKVVSNVVVVVLNYVFSKLFIFKKKEEKQP